MTTLGDYLKAEGFKVNDSDVPYGRDTTWRGVGWLFVHHTADTCDPAQAAARARYIKTAEGRYPPLSQLMLGRDQKVYVCAKQRSGQGEPGRASHAGDGAYPGIPTNTGNEVGLGVEVQCSGAHPLAHHADSYDTMIRLLAALCRRYGLDQTQVIGHKEYSSTGKIDPRDSMGTIRADVKAALAGGDDDVVQYASMSRTGDIVLEPGVPRWVGWESESSDDWGGHKGTNAGVNLPGGVCEGGAIFFTDGPCLAELVRAPAGSAADDSGMTLLGGTQHQGGRGTLVVPPFSAVDAVYLRLTAPDDIGPPTTLLSASLRLTVSGRQKG